MNQAVPHVAELGGISVTQLLFVLAFMLILMVATLSVLVQRRARDLRDWPFIGPLSDWVLSDDPKQSVLLLRYLVGAANAIAGVAALNYGVAQGEVDPVGCGWLTASALIVSLTFYAVIRSGLNKRFQDPSLSWPQILIAEAYLAWGYVLGGPGGPVALLILFVFLMFSMFVSTSRVLIRASVTAVLLFGPAMLHVAHTMRASAPYTARIQLVYFFVMLFMLASVCLMVSQLNRIRGKSHRRKKELAEALVRIQNLATRDELTGLFNRRHMLEVLNTEKQRCIRTERRFCLAMIDVDHFKAVNDTHGHVVGDQVLAAVATVIAGGLRETDVVSRWGGEEFLIMFTDTDCPTAELVLTRIQMMLSATTVSQISPDLHVTFSAGLTHYEPEELLTRTIDRADRALYQAKAAGRNRVNRLEPEADSVALEHGHALDVGRVREHVHRSA